MTQHQGPYDCHHVNENEAGNQLILRHSKDLRTENGSHHNHRLNPIVVDQEGD